MIFWLELLHAPPVVDLGGRDRALQVFGCRYDCLPRRLADRGAGIVTRIADVRARSGADGSRQTQVLPEFWILGWWETDDTIPEGCEIDDMTFSHHIREIHDRLREAPEFAGSRFFVFMGSLVQVGGAIPIPQRVIEEIRADDWTPWMQVAPVTSGDVPGLLTADDLGTRMHIEGSRLRRHKWGPLRWTTEVPVNTSPRGYRGKTPGVPPLVVVLSSPDGNTSWHTHWADFPEGSEDDVLGFRRGSGIDVEYAFIVCSRPSR